MTPRRPGRPKKLTGFIPELIGRESTVSLNTSQEVIITTADKVMLRLIDHKNALISRVSWETPLGMLLTMVAALVSSTFNPVLGIPADFWRAAFQLGAVVSFLWLALAIWECYRDWHKADPASVIRALKEGQGLYPPSPKPQEPSE